MAAATSRRVIGRLNTSKVRHRRPDGSRNTVVPAVVFTASVAAVVTAERARKVNEIPL
jgi:hypothetical protein